MSSDRSIKADQIGAYLTTFVLSKNSDTNGVTRSRRARFKLSPVMQSHFTVLYIYKEQQTIHKAIEDRLKDLYANQLYSELISAQIVTGQTSEMTRSDAASRVVAAQKQKEASSNTRKRHRSTRERAIQNQSTPVATGF